MSSMNEDSDAQLAYEAALCDESLKHEIAGRNAKLMRNGGDSRRLKNPIVRARSVYQKEEQADRVIRFVYDKDTGDVHYLGSKPRIGSEEPTISDCVGTILEGKLEVGERNGLQQILGVSLSEGTHPFASEVIGLSIRDYNKNPIRSVPQDLIETAPRLSSPLAGTPAPRESWFDRALRYIGF